jgi:hypothetical protein
MADNWMELLNALQGGTQAGNGLRVLHLAERERRLVRQQRRLIGQGSHERLPRPSALPIPQRQDGPPAQRNRHRRIQQAPRQKRHHVDVGHVHGGHGRNRRRKRLHHHGRCGRHRYRFLSPHNSSHSQNLHNKPLHPHKPTPMHRNTHTNRQLQINNNLSAS